MKFLKKLFPIIVIIFDFYLNLIIYKQMQLTTLFQIMFLDFKAPEKYSVSLLNIRMIIFFMALIITLIFSDYKISNGDGQINTLVIYRTGRKSFFKKVVMDIGKSLILEYTLVVIAILACSVIGHIPIINLSLPLIYLIRLFIEIFIIESTIQLLSLKYNWTFLQISLICLILFVICFDQLFLLNVITYSNNLKSELIRLISWIIITTISVAIEFKVLNQEKELI